MHKEIEAAAKKTVEGMAWAGTGVAADDLLLIVTTAMHQGAGIAQNRAIAASLADGFAKLHPCDGDLLVYTCDPDNHPTVGAIEEFRDILQANGATVTITCLNQGETLEVSE